MLIASVSDLHTDYPENRQAVVALATEIHRRKADVAIIAGDISHKNDRIRRVLTAFVEVAPTVLYVPGNHDVWFDNKAARNDPSQDTWHRYRDELRELTDATGVHYLPAEPLIVGNVGFAGTCGWYDYSFLLPELRDRAADALVEKKQFGGLQWVDGQLTAFRNSDCEIMPDADVAREMEGELEEQLQGLQKNPKVEHIVAVTHHQAFDAVVKRTHKLPWEYFNAFMGSVKLGETIADFDKVRAAIYGHTHFGNDVTVGGIRVYGTPLGYPRERRGVDEEAVIETRIGWLEL